VDCHRLTVQSPYNGLEKNSIQDALTVLAGAPHFVYTKIPCDDIAAVAMLSEIGFYVVDASVHLRKRRTRGSELIAGCRTAVPGDAQDVEGVAARGFVFSRFHLDPGFDNGVADRLKAAWAGNYFLGKRGDRMVVAERDGAIAGFALLIENGAEAIIDLIAVAPEYRREGFGRALCRSAEALCQGARDMIVGTQVANSPSLALYNDLGYRQTQAGYVLHYHGA